MIEIDGSQGEGGGQVLRTSLALSIVTGKPFRLYNIRAGRKKPGLGKQHLACVRAAQAVSHADVRGEALGSRDLRFHPEGSFSGDYQFGVGSAGSAGLVLQTVLYPLLLCESESRVSIDGGTHNPWAPPFDFLLQAFVPVVQQMGIDMNLSLERFGFYPAGGGLIHCRVSPWRNRSALDLTERGPVELSAVAYVGNLPQHVGERELKVASRHLPLREKRIESPQVMGAGNALCIVASSQHVTEVVTAFGDRRKPAEVVAKEAVHEIQEYLQHAIPVGPHLADQLLLPMALGKGGRLLTTHPTPHTTTNAAIIRTFIDVPIRVEKQDRGWMVSVGSP
jgi:RNA 3'-terminal phosphate cyclase (ATP)